MKTLLEVAKNLIFFKNEKSSSEIKNLNIKSSSDIVKQIHEDFFTEVDKLLEEVKISKTVETDKQDLIKKSERLKNLGFNNNEVKEANEEIVRLSKIENENNIRKEIHQAIIYFSNKYPLYKFITEESVKKICKKYNLIYGDVKYFKGNVPEKNLDKIESFKIDEKDACYFIEKKWSFNYTDINIVDYSEYKLNIENDLNHNNSNSGYIFNAGIYPLEIAATLSDFDLTSLDVKDFNIEKKVIKILYPIVLKSVFFQGKKYYLIVTAWGPEASDELVVNERMN